MPCVRGARLGVAATGIDARREIEGGIASQRACFLDARERDAQVVVRRQRVVHEFVEFRRRRSVCQNCAVALSGGVGRLRRCRTSPRPLFRARGSSGPPRRPPARPRRSELTGTVNLRMRDNLGTNRRRRPSSAPGAATQRTRASAADRTRSRRSFPRTPPRPWRDALRRRRPLASTSGNTPMMNAMDVITMGRSRRRAASSTAVTRSRPSFLQMLRELDDQDGVLGGEAHEHQEADLREDVVVAALEPDAHECRPAAPSARSG